MADVPGQVQLTSGQRAWLQAMGVDRRLLSLYGEPPAAPAMPSAAPVAPSLAPAAPSPAPVVPPRRPVSQTPSDASVPTPAQPVVHMPVPDSLKDLEQVVSACTQCPLHAGRHKVVFGAGQAQSPQWMIIGEAPGDLDDQSGIPFQGAAGQLLQAMLTASGLLPDTSLYYTHALKCRPRGGRAPRPDELTACLPHLRQQIEWVKPRGLLVLGWQAASVLLGRKARLDQLRGQAHTYTMASGEMIPMVVTWHPAVLLLRGQNKADAWRDLLKARTLLA